jgi:16S rRNA (uracil1498-N3)-methyltransferase
MYRFYAHESQVEDEYIRIIGQDVNHIKNVLRLKSGDPIIICNGQGKDFYCIIEEALDGHILGKIKEVKENDSELNTKIYLFQGVPKKDKMELIVQKAVELGVYEIIPVMSSRTIVKIEDKRKERKKIERWQAIATAAAKQSKRGIIPVVKDVMSFSGAMNYKEDLECKIIPYENASDIKKTREIINNISKKKSIGIFIGPEGGFDEKEIHTAKEHGFLPITLGNRILRTETAGLAILSMIMLQVEE